MSGTEGPMPIKAIAPWFGGKRTLAPMIVAELGDHCSYFEPFCGGLAVLFAKQQCRHELVNDLHGRLINLARILASEDAVALYERLNRTLFCEAIHDDASAAMENYETLSPLDAAYWYFVFSWMGRNGFSGIKNQPSNFCLRYTTKGGDNGSRFSAAIASIPAWHYRFRRTYITSRDAFEIIPKIPDEVGVAVYCDPPYVAKTTQYQHDFKSDDHRRLAECLGRFKAARIVVSYYPDPLLAELYRGWTILEIDVAKNTGHACSRGKKNGRATEMLLMNGPSYTAPADSPLFRERT